MNLTSFLSHLLYVAHFVYIFLCVYLTFCVFYPVCILPYMYPTPCVFQSVYLTPYISSHVYPNLSPCVFHSLSISNFVSILSRINHISSTSYLIYIPFLMCIQLNLYSITCISHSVSVHIPS